MRVTLELTSHCTWHHRCTLTTESDQQSKTVNEVRSVRTAQLPHATQLATSDVLPLRGLIFTACDRSDLENTCRGFCSCACHDHDHRHGGAPEETLTVWDALWNARGGADCDSGSCDFAACSQGRQTPCHSCRQVLPTAPCSVWWPLGHPGLRNHPSLALAHPDPLAGPSSGCSTSAC